MALEITPQMQPVPKGLSKVIYSALKVFNILIVFILCYRST